MNDNKELTVKDSEIITSLVLNGDISKLTSEQKVTYYNHLCDTLQLNPITKPFQILKLQGKEVLYATKDATEQLRKLYGVSVIDQTDKVINDIFVVNVRLQDAKGRIDTGKGAVNIKGLSGDALANAMMKAETKAKRRGTLSICGLGMLDETELETIPNVKIIPNEDNVKDMFNGQDVTEQENINKLTALPERIKDGLRIVSNKNSKKAIQICVDNEWNETKLEEYLKKELK